MDSGKLGRYVLLSGVLGRGGGRGVYIGGAFVHLLSHFFVWEIIGIFENPLVNYDILALFNKHLSCLPRLTITLYFVLRQR